MPQEVALEKEAKDKKKRQKTKKIFLFTSGAYEYTSSAILMLIDLTLHFRKLYQVITQIPFNNKILLRDHRPEGFFLFVFWFFFVFSGPQT